MTDLSTQKRMAAEIMDVGENRVKIDPEEKNRIEEAITRQDIRNLIESGAITKKDKKGTSKGRSKEKKKQKAKKRQKGHGSRKGKQTARKDDKQEWMEKIRALREELKKKRDNGEINSKQYRSLYNKAKGGYFRDKKHLNNYIEQEVRE